MSTKRRVEEVVNTGKVYFHCDQFLGLDHMGPVVVHKPGEAVGVPYYPHTVMYIVDHK